MKTTSGNLQIKTEKYRHRPLTPDSEITCAFA